VSRLPLLLALLVGCNRGAAPPPDAARTGEPPAPVAAAPEPAVTPTIVAAAPERAPSPNTAPPGPPAEPPSIAATTTGIAEPDGVTDGVIDDATGGTTEGGVVGEDGLTDAERLAFARALEPKIPDAVTIVAAQRRRAGWFVLYHVEAAPRWRAAQEQGPALARRLEALAAAQERCEEDSSSQSSVNGCILDAAPDPALGWETLGNKVVTYELARLEGANLKIGAHLVLSGLAMPDDDPSVPLKLQIFDIDRDGGDEITAIVPIKLPDDDAFTQTYGALGTIIDARTFTRQFSTARLHVYDYSHAEDQTTETHEVKWFAADESGDGHPDLRVRETHRRDETEGRTISRDRKELCPYSPEDDRWHCPGPPFAEGLLLPPIEGRPASPI